MADPTTPGVTPDRNSRSEDTAREDTAREGVVFDDVPSQFEATRSPRPTYVMRQQFLQQEQYPEPPRQTPSAAGASAPSQPWWRVSAPQPAIEDTAASASAPLADANAPPSQDAVSPTPLNDARRLQLLDTAHGEQPAGDDPLQWAEDRAYAAAIGLLGGADTLGRVITGSESLIHALAAGFPGQVLRQLQSCGYPHEVLEHVVAPRRTLMRRRKDGERLTCEESDAAWRLAFALAFAEQVLNGRAAALAWLLRPKPNLDQQRPIDLLRTSVGAAYVHRLLQRLDWGDVA